MPRYFSSISAAVILASVAFSAQAIPLKGKDGKATCMSASAMSSALKAETQKSALIMNRMALTFDKNGTPIDSPWLANIFTISAKGEGYNVEGNNPVGTPSTEFCVVAKYFNVRLNDWAKPGIPDFAISGITDNDIAKVSCKTGHNKGYNCGMSDTMLRSAQKNLGFHVMLVAQSVGDDDKIGKKLIVAARPSDLTGSVFATDAQGVGIELFMLKDAAYTDVGKAIIGSD